MQTDITTDGRRIAIAVRGMAAIEAAENGAVLYVATPAGWDLVSDARRDWVLSRARRKRSKATIEWFGSTLECRWCLGRGVEIVPHPQWGDQVTDCPDCAGTGTLCATIPPSAQPSDTMRNNDAEKRS